MRYEHAQRVEPKKCTTVASRHARPSQRNDEEPDAHENSQTEAIRHRQRWSDGNTEQQPQAHPHRAKRGQEDPNHVPDRGSVFARVVASISFRRDAGSPEKSSHEALRHVKLRRLPAHFAHVRSLRSQPLLRARFVDVDADARALEFHQP